jgi:hypothetical protein
MNFLAACKTPLAEKAMYNDFWTSLFEQVRRFVFGYHNLCNFLTQKALNHARFHGGSSMLPAKPFIRFISLCLFDGLPVAMRR